MNKKIVRRDVDLANLPPLTEKQKAELAALATRPDGEIDYRDIPPLTEGFWNSAVRGRFYKPTKTSTTVRIDSDVLAWLRAQGKGYQSRINAILRREMLSLISKRSSGAGTGAVAGSGVSTRHGTEISHRHGNTHVGTLRKRYGAGFASGFKDADTLAHVLATLGQPSLAKLIEDSAA